jgi:hypothetical protein
MFSCGNDQGVKVASEIVVKAPVLNTNTVVEVIEIPDTIKLLSKIWKSVYYIKNSDTIFSDTPFEIEFINDSNGLFYKLNNQFSPDQQWKFENSLFESRGAETHYYHVIEISDSCFRTRDTMKVGFEYFFTAVK